jgi:hypothetical protein
MMDPGLQELHNRLHMPWRNLAWAGKATLSMEIEVTIVQGQGFFVDQLAAASSFEFMNVFNKFCQKMIAYRPMRRGEGISKSLFVVYEP